MNRGWEGRVRFHPAMIQAFLYELITEGWIQRFLLFFPPPG